MTAVYIGMEMGKINAMSSQESEPSQTDVLTIQKSPQRVFDHLKVLGRTAGIAIFAAVFYLLYWKDSSIRQQHETLFWGLALIGGAAALWWSEYSKLRASTTRKTPPRIRQHLKIAGKIAGIALSSAIVDFVFFKDNPMAEQYEVYLRWFTLLFAALAIWALIQDWLITRGMTFVFDGNRKVFRVMDKNHDLFQLPFQAIKRIKVQESSNFMPVYTLFIHLQDGQAMEIDTSAKPEEMNGLANQLSGMTGAPIIIQRYNESLSKDEKEEQMWQSNEIYKGD
ncbi:MAG: hypothetical protein P8183_20980 [Anaerolineae bacterium]